MVDQNQYGGANILSKYFTVDDQYEKYPENTETLRKRQSDSDLFK